MKEQKKNCLYSELLEVLESNAKAAVKEAENKKGIRTSAKKLEEEKPEKKTTRQSKAQPKTKDINKSK